ncbi:DNA polymerase III subunit epsilon [Candidatus Finniella inopinata]|uniref:DNA polymerase III subunit epsilon n=1 Tax=Candidatus Finniella inopinata TaxID=1696036 RepID=A0A4Q7DG24_9PROT|nr:DNA polymerase III subunit epsilon [Candidatus Finniella inopinata]RZI45602.1 DNA polymerase III subunit epsilon [Candidatus Finniella inopinata]
MLREIILDTETTGLSHQAGHRIVEIGCIELLNHMPTGKHYQVYINPEREVPPESTAITGLTHDFLKNHGVFASVADDFLSFIQDDRLVIHNANFDVGFLNAELVRLNKPKIEMYRVVDTLLIARRKFPGSPASLDALCKRFQIDLGGRSKHGALLDSQLLAQVYLELLGGRQRQLGIQKDAGRQENQDISNSTVVVFPRRDFVLKSGEEESHKDFVKKIYGNLWGY